MKRGPGNQGIWFGMNKSLVNKDKNNTYAEVFELLYCVSSQWIGICWQKGFHLVKYVFPFLFWNNHLEMIIYSISLEFWVKVQFKGPKLYKKKRALFQKESYCQRILRSSSWNLYAFHLINIVFWWQIFMASRPPMIGKTTIFWSWTLWWWHHNVGAWQLLAIHTLQSMTTTRR